MHGFEQPEAVVGRGGVVIAGRELDAPGADVLGEARELDGPSGVRVLCSDQHGRPAIGRPHDGLAHCLPLVERQHREVAPGAGGQEHTASGPDASFHHVANVLPDGIVIDAEVIVVVGDDRNQRSTNGSLGVRRSHGSSLPSALRVCYTPPRR